MKNPKTSSQPPEFFSQEVQEARRFYLDLAPRPDIPLAVVCGGWELCSADYSIHRQTFPYYSIEFVARGRGSLTLGKHESSLFPGAVFSYGPGTPQDITTDPEEPLLKYFVDFTGSKAPGLLKKCSLSPGSSAQLFAPGEIQDALDNLIRDGLKDTGFAPVLCAALLRYLILKIAESRMPGKAGQTHSYATYQRCRHHMVENCLNLRSLEQVARECHIDRAYVCRLFRRYDHQTPHQFLTRRKMNLAAERLQNPAVLVKQVAADLGFDDPFHFSRTFKRVFGLSPDAFRRLR